MRISRKNRRESGTAALEFALVAMPIIFTLIGVVVVGINLGRSIQVGQICRDADSMYVRGVDFSQTSSQNLLVKLAGGLNITDAGGNGVIIFSEFDGTGANTAVCSRRIVVGNASLRSSSYANPSAAVLDQGGNVTNLNDPSAQVNASFMSLLPMTQGQVAYLVETYFSTSQYDWTGFLSGTGIYAKAIF